MPYTNTQIRQYTKIQVFVLAWVMVMIRMMILRVILMPLAIAMMIVMASNSSCFPFMGACEAVDARTPEPLDIGHLNS